MSDTRSSLWDKTLVKNRVKQGDKLPLWLPVLLGFLTAVGPISTDVYLPALPEMERQLGSAVGTGSLTMTAWVIGLALGQIVAGPLTDRFGRRRPLLVGTLFYMIASSGCALATDMTTLCVFRACAALMGAASLVVPNACIRDVTIGNATAKLMSRLILIQGIVPILAPALGGFALQFMSWRDIFWATSLYGAVGLCAVLFFLPETLQPENRQPFKVFPVIVRYGDILKDKHYRYNAMIAMLQGFVTFTYLTAAPFLFETVYGFSPFHYGILFGVTAVCMIGSSQINAWLLGHFRSTMLLRVGLSIACIGACILLGLAVWSALDSDASGHLKSLYLWPIIVALMMTLAPEGSITPNAMAGALLTQGKNAGSATALAGTGQYVMGIIASSLFALLPVGTAIPMAGMFIVAFMMMSLCVKLSPA